MEELRAFVKERKDWKTKMRADAKSLKNVGNKKINRDRIAE
jgi:hypothetical protein